MKTAVLFLCLAACGTVRADPAVPQAEGLDPGYALAWSDEFDGAALDAAKWEYRTDSKALSTQKSENVSVGNGVLRLALKKEDAGGKAYTGGGIISRELFQYGYYEARFRIPPGAGWHTSFWAQRHDGSGGTSPKGAAQEIDFCEQDSIKPFSYSAGVIDWGATRKNLGRTRPRTPDLSADFHVWGCEFTPAVVRFFFDGKETHRVDAAAFVNGTQNIWLTSIGYGKPEAMDEGKLPAAAEFDYVRFFQKKP